MIVRLLSRSQYDGNSNLKVQLLFPADDDPSPRTPLKLRVDRMKHDFPAKIVGGWLAADPSSSENSCVQK